jgi:hypothetical protein
MPAHLHRRVRRLATVTSVAIVIPPIAAPHHPGLAAAVRAQPTWAASAGSARPVLLISGDRLLAERLPGAGIRLALLPGAEPQAFLGLRLNDQTLDVPIDALPYLGNGLDPSLFDVAAVRRAESGGRLPVVVGFSGKRPAPPGITVTGSGPGHLNGYLTASGARRFGEALARQDQTLSARGSYGRDGLFTDRTQIRLAGVAAPVVTPRPRSSALRTLTVTATNLDGRPDTGGTVMVVNADNQNRYHRVGHFSHGIARFKVPAGHYYEFSNFARFGSHPSLHLVVQPQFTVRHATIVHASERSATSEIFFATPRPAVRQMSQFTLVRHDAQGRDVIAAWTAFGVPLWISPTTKRPTVGTLRSYTAGQLTSPARAAGLPYAYNLDFAGPAGLVPAQRWTAPPASLATVTDRYYQDVSSAGAWGVIGGRRAEVSLGSLTTMLNPMHLPGRQIQYFSAGPDIAWSSFYHEQLPAPAAGQGDGQQQGPDGPGFRTMPAGRRLTVNWGAYPLHPQPDVQPLGGSWGQFLRQFPSAARAGNLLTLYVTPFSDNYSGHLGNAGPGALPVTKVTSHYAIYQNGTEIAHGTPIDNTGAPVVIPTAKLSTRPSVIRFVLSAARIGSHFPLSPASQTTWTWRSARQPAAKVPPSWFCFTTNGTSRNCAVQPMLTLDYHVHKLAMNGRAPAGRQDIGLDIGHIQPGPQLPITRASAAVSFNNGKTWHHTTITAQGAGHFQITFNAPAANVTLRVSATDARDGTITETITSAYHTT